MTTRPVRGVLFLAAVALVVAGCATAAPGLPIVGMYQSMASKPDKPDHCPPPNAKENFKRVMNMGSIADFFDCPVEVEAQFVDTNTGNTGNMPRYLQTDGYTLFRVLPVGETAKSIGPFGATNSVYVAVKKGKDDLVFNLKAGDKLDLTGFPDFVYMASKPMSQLFLASSVVKAK